MVTEAVPISSAMKFRLANLLVKSAEKASTPKARTWVQSLSRFVLHIAGFSCLTIAGFMWDNVAGMIVAGISCFALSTLLTTKNPTPPPPQRMR